MKESKSIIEEIENSKKYDAVLMTTFNIEFSFFERYLLHLYLNNSIRHINVFVDSKQLNESLKDEMPLHFGKKYYVSPIDINGAFHPKVILMLGANKAKLIISSANIKMSGYMTNNEIFQTFYYDENNKEYESLIYESTEMFKKLNLMTEIPDRGTQKLLDKFKINQPTEYCQTRLLTSIDDSIFHQLQFLIHDEIKEIKAAVHFYDQHLTALEQLQETFQCKNTKLYIQNELNTFPVEYNKKYKKISNQSITVFDSILVDGKQKSSFYHGKVFEFVGKNNTYIFYGSANCTANALMRNKTENGNVEC